MDLELEVMRALLQALDRVSSQSKFCLQALRHMC